jgi:hypothetical protein
MMASPSSLWSFLGHTLKHEIGGKPIPIDRLVDLAMQMADALDAAHQKGITVTSFALGRPR